VVALLDVPVLAQLLAASVGREAKEEAAEERDLGAVSARFVHHSTVALDPETIGSPKRTFTPLWVAVTELQ
jgi:hypothetical protein